VTISRRSRSKLLRDYFTSELTDCGLTMQVSCLKRTTNIVAGAQEDTLEVVGRYRNMLRDTYSDTTNIECTVSCTRSCNIAASGVGVPHLGAAGRHAWPKIWEGLRTLYIIHTR